MIEFIVILLLIFSIYKLSQREEYRRLEDVGTLPLPLHVTTSLKHDDNTLKHKYSDIMYKHNRRYNFLNRQNTEHSSNGTSY